VFDTAAGVILLVLAIVLGLQLLHGTLGSWLAAKFLNRVG
jgi:hypothetical protein